MSIVDIENEVKHMVKDGMLDNRFLDLIKHDGVITLINIHENVIKDAIIEEVSDSSYGSGYKDGHTEGYGEGYEDGHSNGYAEAKEEQVNV